MIIEHYIPKNFERVVDKFKYNFFIEDIHSVRCVAYEARVSDEISAIYEIYYKEQNRYEHYGVVLLDHYDEGITQRITDTMKTWSRSEKVELLELNEGVNYLYRLYNPLKFNA